MVNTLYYSKYCPTCQKLMNLLEKYQLSSILFDRIICVDNANNDGYMTNLPKFVTCVPVITTPDYNVPLIDNTIFDWVDYKIYQIVSKNNSKQVQKNDEITPITHQNQVTSFHQQNNQKMEKEIPIMESSSNEKSTKEVYKDFENIQKQRAMDDQMLFK